MRVGVPKEIKTLEFRIGATPGVVQRLIHEGHEVFVEAGAGAGIGLAGGLSAFLASFVLGAAFGLVALALRRLDRKSRLPFAPFMAVGAALGLAFPLPFAFAA